MELARECPLLHDKIVRLLQYSLLDTRMLQHESLYIACAAVHIVTSDDDHPDKRVQAAAHGLIDAVGYGASYEHVAL